MLTEKQLEAAALVAKGHVSLNAIAARVGCGARTLDDWKTLPEFEAEVVRTTNELRDRVVKRGIGNRDRRLNTKNTLLRRSIGFMLHRKAAMEAQILGEIEDLGEQALQAQGRIRLVNDAILRCNSEMAGKDLGPGDRKKLRAEIDQHADSADYWTGIVRTCKRKAANLQACLPMVRSGLARMEAKSLHVGKEAYEVVNEFFYDRELVSEIRALMEQAAVETGQWKNKLTLENPDGTALQTGITVTFVSAAKKDDNE